mmetsp:Transcript_9433/g.17895  ORF Transcript_9433/g.17895 Transcript_9433/m.17895 type:complete len:169 (+) Transcript_9433:243-749(+)
MVDRPVPSFVHDFVRQFMNAPANVDKAQFVVSQHNDGHEPSYASITYQEGLHASFLQEMADSGYLDKTLYFLISDHGSNYWHKNFHAGAVESVLPLGLILVPKAWLDANPGVRQTLLHNEQAVINQETLRNTWIDITTGRIHRPEGSNRNTLFVPQSYSKDCPGLLQL